VTSAIALCEIRKKSERNHFLSWRNNNNKSVNIFDGKMQKVETDLSVNIYL